MWRKPVLPAAAVAFAAGLTLTAVAIVVTMSGSPLVVAHANTTTAAKPIIRAGSHAGACQVEELLPAGISAIRIPLLADTGPRVKVAVLRGPQSLASGVADSGWTSGAVTVPVKPVQQAFYHVRVCFGLGPTSERVRLDGSIASAAVAARSLTGAVLPGRFTVEYMRRGSSSWWSLAETVARHMGLGRALSGSGIALLALALMGTAIAAGSWLVVKELR
jgi:hypothetical protein